MTLKTGFVVMGHIYEGVLKGKQINLFLMSNAKGDVMQNKMSLLLHPNRFGEI